MAEHVAQICLCGRAAHTECTILDVVLSLQSNNTFVENSFKWCNEHVEVIVSGYKGNKCADLA